MSHQESNSLMYETLSICNQLGLNKCDWSNFKLAYDMAVLNNLSKPTI